MRRAREALVVLLALILSSCGRPVAHPFGEEARSSAPATAGQSNAPEEVAGPMTPPGGQDEGSGQKLEVATLGAGCFWCVEAVFSELRGVKSVTSGYAGGTVENPTYRQVCEGTTGHAEAVQVTFDPRELSYHDVLEVFFTTHDPTTLNRQGADVGTQYRSAIFYHGDSQRQVAETVRKEMQPAFSSPIVTEIVPFSNFYAAEKYHQEYYANNPAEGYCRVVINPKLEKFRQKHRSLLKTPAAR